MVLKKFFRSLSHALRGLLYVWKEELNFRIQLLIAAFLIGVVFFFRFSYTEAALVIFSIILVLGAEIINTIVEDMLDKIEPNHHTLIGHIKDMMAGVVLVTSIGACAIGVATFVHHFLFAPIS
jgi:diacylglycerol kinase (ATP)